MQNVQIWSKNVMKYDDFDGRMLIEMNDVSNRKIMENGKIEVENCSLAESTDKQNTEDRQLGSLTEREQQPKSRELMADDRWLEQPEHGNE